MPTALAYHLTSMPWHKSGVRSRYFHALYYTTLYQFMFYIQQYSLALYTYHATQHTNSQSCQLYFTLSAASPVSRSNAPVPALESVELSNEFSGPRLEAFLAQTWSAGMAALCSLRHSAVLVCFIHLSHTAHLSWWYTIYTTCQTVTPPRHGTLPNAWATAWACQLAGCWAHAHARYQRAGIHPIHGPGQPLTYHRTRRYPDTVAQHSKPHIHVLPTVSSITPHTTLNVCNHTFHTLETLLLLCPTSPIQISFRNSSSSYSAQISSYASHSPELAAFAN